MFIHFLITLFDKLTPLFSGGGIFVFICVLCMSNFSVFCFSQGYYSDNEDSEKDLPKKGKKCVQVFNKIKLLSLVNATISKHFSR